MGNSRIPAPELPDQVQWFNTEPPARIAALRGKVVLLHIWTYSSVNCAHSCADLAYLEQKYPDSLTVIGVHTPKFANEHVAANVHKAINRYRLQHPVAHDPAFAVWRQYGIRAWPSVVFIDPEGYVVGVVRGEGRRRQLDAMIREALDNAERQGLRRDSPTPVSIEPEAERVLQFPGRLLATRERLYISDSGHNRVIEAMPNGRILGLYGSGAPGRLDGHGEEVAFSDPQGLALVGDTLFVADRGNHAIRRIDLPKGEVVTVAGTGEQGGVGVPDRAPLRAALNSPADLCHDDDVLYIAMAGADQIWSLDRKRGVLEVFAGSGQQGIVDGGGEAADFAQPSAIAAGDYLEPTLYVADASTSAVRALRRRTANVSTLTGAGLYDFGDRDGPGRQARLQNPLALAYDGARHALWIADTYNHKIKRLDLATEQVSSFPISQRLWEPGGLSLAGDILWLANTNAHQLVRVDLSTGASEVVEPYLPEGTLMR